MQGEPDFWTNQDKAQKTIQAQKTLNALLKPYEEVSSAINDVNALAELSEEDPTLEPELTGEVDRAVNLFDKIELMAMMSGKQDSANAIVSLKPGAGGTDACDFAEIMYRMFGRPRRAAPEQDAVGRAADPQVGCPGREPDRAEPAQELRQRPEAPEGPAVRDRGAEADRRHREALRRQGRDRVRQPDPELRVA